MSKGRNIISSCVPSQANTRWRERKNAREERECRFAEICCVAFLCCILSFFSAFRRDLTDAAAPLVSCPARTVMYYYVKISLSQSVSKSVTIV